MTFYHAPADHERLRLHLAWDGAKFVGWQSQPRQRSVQDTLHEALLGLMDCTRPVAAGRTDAGVHAQDMCVHVDAARGSVRPQMHQLARALNTKLPPDLAVLSADKAPPGFHARFSCVERQYIYRVLHAPQRHPLHAGRALHVPQPLDVNAMQQAAEMLIGCHDFAAFATQEERQTVRELRRLEVLRSGELLEFHVAGESFLRHMVRGLVGTLLDVGLGRREPLNAPDILASRERARAGANAPAYGLYFVGARYPENALNEAAT